MPIRLRDDGLPVVEFDPALEMSPFVLYRRIGEGRAPDLYDVRTAPGPRTLEGARPWPGPGWSPPDDRDVVLFDDDGAKAIPLARELHRQGHERVRVLFGGLDLYEFSLDPQVVGETTYLVERG